MDDSYEARNLALITRLDSFHELIPEIISELAIELGELHCRKDSLQLVLRGGSGGYFSVEELCPAFDYESQHNSKIDVYIDAEGTVCIENVGMDERIVDYIRHCRLVSVVVYARKRSVCIRQELLELHREVREHARLVQAIKNSVKCNIQ